MARDVPRPHTFIYALALFAAKSKTSSKVHALNLAIHEVFDGSLELAKQLSTSPVHSTSLIEYLDYFHFLSVKQRDYKPTAILAFDHAFRKASDFHRYMLGDYMAREQAGLHHFSQRNLLLDPGAHYSNRASNFDRSGLGGSGGDSYPNGKLRGLQHVEPR